MSNIIAGIALSVCLPPEDMAKLAELVTENSRLRAQVEALLKVKEAAGNARYVLEDGEIQDELNQALTAYTAWETANAKPAAVVDPDAEAKRIAWEWGQASGRKAHGNLETFWNYTPEEDRNGWRAVAAIEKENAAGRDWMLVPTRPTKTIDSNYKPPPGEPDGGK